MCPCRALYECVCFFLDLELWGSYRSLLRQHQLFEVSIGLDEALVPQQNGLARDTHRAECALSTAPIRNGVNAETTAYA